MPWRKVMSACASAGESLRSLSMRYSIMMPRFGWRALICLMVWWISSSVYFSARGMIDRRISARALWRLSARPTAGKDWASRSMARGMPTVETRMRAGVRSKQ